MKKVGQNEQSGRNGQNVQSGQNEQSGWNVQIEKIYKRMLGYKMQGRLLANAPLKGETYFKIGGPADVLFYPETVAEAVKIVKLCRREKVPLTVLGNGSNVLVLDAGVRGVVMKLSAIRGLRRERDRIFAGAGVLLSEAGRFAALEGLSGFEFACGIPGTVGGAVYMNAGAYEREMKDIVCRTVVIEPSGDIGVINGAGHEFAYRSSVFQRNGCIILEAEFILMQSDKENIDKLIETYWEKREKSQPLDMPSAGSVFRRPETEGLYVGPMIEDCGLKGVSVGGAQVSDKHAGFIVNKGGATAADVLSLIDLVRAAVRKRYSVDLATEIQIIGE